MKLRKTQNRAQELKKNHKGQRERYVITSKEEVFISHIYVPNYIASADKQTNKQNKTKQYQQKSRETWMELLMISKADKRKQRC